MKHKILIVTSEFKFSGPNNVIKSLLAGLSGKNVDISVTSLRERNDQSFVKALGVKEEKVYHQDRSSSFLYLFSLLFKLKPNIVNSHGIRADCFLFLFSFLFKYKLFSTVHNIPNEDYLFRYGRVIGTVMLSLHLIIFKSKRVKKIAVSNQVKDNLLRLGAKNVTTIYNGVNDDFFCPATTNERKDIESQLNLQAGRKRIVFCGHLTPLKDPLVVADIANKYPCIDFLFLGSGPLKDSMVGYGNNVLVLGRVNNVRDYLAVSDYYIMPSHTEGMPMALIEAMLMNLPLICSDIPIFKELSKISNITMHNFKVGNKDSLITCIANAIKYTDSFNRVVAIENFTSKVMANNYLRVFNVYN